MPFNRFWLIAMKQHDANRYRLIRLLTQSEKEYDRNAHKSYIGHLRPVITPYQMAFLYCCDKLSPSLDFAINLKFYQNPQFSAKSDACSILGSHCWVRQLPHLAR